MPTRDSSGVSLKKSFYWTSSHFPTLPFFHIMCSLMLWAQWFLFLSHFNVREERHINGRFLYFKHLFHCQHHSFCRSPNWWLCLEPPHKAKPITHNKRWGAPLPNECVWSWAVQNLHCCAWQLWFKCWV